MGELVYSLVCRGRTSEFKKNIRQHAPFVDKSVIILHGHDKDNEAFLNSSECKDLNIEWSVVDMPYHPPSLRGAYLERVFPGDWCLQLDCDEYLEEPACYKLREIIKEADGQGFNRIAFNAHDIRVGLDGAVWDACSSYHNPMLIKIFPGTQWVGETHGGIGAPGVSPKIAKVPYRYFHIKTTASEYLRGCRNYWTTGEVAQNNTNVPEWKEFKSLCSKYGFELFDDLYQSMVNGGLHEDFKQWMILNRNNNNSEARSWFICYFGLMHPEENIFLAGNMDLEYDKDRAPFTGEMTY